MTVTSLRALHLHMIPKNSDIYCKDVWNRIFYFGSVSVCKNSDSVRNEFGSVKKDVLQFGYYSYVLLV